MWQSLDCEDNQNFYWRLDVKRCMQSIIILRCTQSIIYIKLPSLACNENNSKFELISFIESILCRAKKVKIISANFTNVIKQN